MSGYAILGATGQVGGSVLKGLLSRSQSQSPTQTQTTPKINVLVRSRTKLDNKLSSPEFSSLSTTPLNIFESPDISNIDNLVACIQNTRSIFLCVAAANNQPGCTIAQDQIRAVISALRTLKDSTQTTNTTAPTKLPRLIVLSSAEAESTPHLSRNIPWPMRNILFCANSYIYNDLIAAENLLRQESDWIEFSIIKPGGLSFDKAQGHELSTEEQQTFISYEDLVNGMIEVADEEDGRHDGRCVSVLVPGGGAKPAYENVPLLFRGLLVHFFPFLYGWLY